MDKSKVYFTTFKTSYTENIPAKLKRLIFTVGIRNIDFTDKYAAIKIHFGELGNLAFLRPNYAKVVADTVKELGGKAFLTDCNTLYVGSFPHIKYCSLSKMLFLLTLSRYPPPLWHNWASERPDCPTPRNES